MAYETNTFANQNDLLAALGTFRSGLTSPYTVNKSSGAELCVSRGTCYANFFAMTNNSTYGSTWGHTGIAIKLSDGFTSTGTSWASQGTIRSKNFNTHNDGDETSGTYHFFDDGLSSAVVVVYGVDNLCSIFAFGELDKLGVSYTGGAFAVGSVTKDAGVTYDTATLHANAHGFFSQAGCGSQPRGALLINGVILGNEGVFSDSARPRIGLSGGLTADGYPNHGLDIQGSLYPTLMMGCQNHNDLTRVLIPCNMLEDYSNNNLMGIAGQCTVCRGIDFHGLTVGQEITVGGKKWLCFPSFDGSVSWPWGFAFYKEDV